MYLKRSFLPLLIITLLFAGCDLVGEDVEEESLETARVIVGSSGAFGKPSTATLTLYNPETDARRQLTTINGFLHSLALRPGGRLYAIVNFGTENGVIRIYADGAYEQPIGQIPVEDPPRAIAFTGGGTALVATQGPFTEDFTPLPGDVAVVDLSSNAVVDTIAVGRQPEDLVITDGKAFVANDASGTLSVIDVASRTALDSIVVDCVHPNELAVDEEGEVVVVCKGDANTDGEILFLDPATGEVTTRLQLDVPIGSRNFTQSAYYSAPAEELYAISTDTRQIVRIDTDANALGGIIPVPESETLVGLTAVAYDAANERLYVGRLPVGDMPGEPDYEAAGTVVVLDESGTRVDAFLVGPSPAHIVLRRN